MYAIRSYYGNYRLRTSITTSPTDITIYGWDGGNYIYVIPVGVSGLTPGECGLLGVDLGVDSAGRITSYNVCYTKLLRDREYRIKPAGNLFKPDRADRVNPEFT